MTARNLTKDRLIASRVVKAESLRDRMRGLLGRDSLPSDEGLWIVPCPQIHTFFMRFPIDAVFLDRDLRVVAVAEGLKPWRVFPLLPWDCGGHSVLELAGGTLQGSASIGDRLEFHG